jgi:hypothetical protein
MDAPPYSVNGLVNSTESSAIGGSASGGNYSVTFAENSIDPLGSGRLRN